MRGEGGLRRGNETISRPSDSFYGGKRGPKGIEELGKDYTN